MDAVVHELSNQAGLETQAVLQIEISVETELLKDLKHVTMGILIIQMDEVVLVQLSLGGPEMQVVLRYDNNVVMG